MGEGGLRRDAEVEAGVVKDVDLMRDERGVG